MRFVANSTSRTRPLDFFVVFHVPFSLFCHDTGIDLGPRSFKGTALFCVYPLSIDTHLETIVFGLSRMVRSDQEKRVFNIHIPLRTI